MNKLEEQLSLMVEKAINVAEQTGQFMLDQAPDVINQFLTWKLSYHLILTLMFLTLIFLIPYIIKTLLSKKNIDDIVEDDKPRWRKDFGRYWYKDYSYSDNSDTLMGYKITRAVSLLFVIGVIVNLIEVVYIVVAPKVYLIEYFVK